MRLFVKKYPKKQFARQLHRLLAYSVALLLAWFSLTGIALNHSDDFKLKDIQIQHPWLLIWYQIDPPKIKRAFQLNDNWLLETQHRLYWNETALPFRGKIHSLVSQGPMVSILLPEQLILLTDKGDLIEQLLLPEPLQSSTQTQKSPQFYQAHQTLILANQNDQAWLLSDDLTTLKAMDAPATIEWQTLDTIQPQVAPKALQQTLSHSFNSPLSLEKVLLELHNGYFLGAVGPWLVDFAALLFVLMVISGIRLHLR